MKKHKKQVKNMNNNEICSYIDQDYKRDFWGGDIKREYEHLAEMLALNKLLNEKGSNIIDLGAGFGRLLEAYVNKYNKEVVLYDYADNLLEEARKTIEKEKHKHVKTIKGDLRKLPFDNNSFDAAIMVRVLHHIKDVPALLKEINRILKDNSIFIMEYANKRNFLEIIKFLINKSKMEPLRRSLTQRGNSLYFNFHPAYIKDEVIKAGFIIEEKLSVSNFRWGRIKKIIPTKVLLHLEDKLQGPLSKITFGPSIFLKLRKR